MMNLTMKSTFLLLALFVGAVGGNHIDAEVQGYTADENNYCTTSVYDALYEECIVTTAEVLGVVFDRRRLELRGSSRALQSCSICPPNPPKGHWCWVKCGYASRRLTVANGNANESANGNGNGNGNADDHADTTTQTAIQAAATECYEAKAAMPEYNCLGAAEDLKIIIEYDGE
jgi:hypothetical protein